MAPRSYDRRNGDRRRGSRSTYTGPERRSGRDRRRTDGRRTYDRNGDEREAYYYGGQSKQQNPVIYFGIAGAVVLLIIIIAVASSGGNDRPRRTSRGAVRMSDDEVRRKEGQARDLVMRGGESMEAARLAYQESGVSAADPHYKVAYNCFQQAHDIYEELNKAFPNSRFYGELKDVESNLYEINKMMGFGD